MPNDVVRELISALSGNQRAAEGLSQAAHRGFTLLEENTRTVFQNSDRIRELERQTAQLRGAVESLVHLEQERQQLRRDELNFERDKQEIEITGEVARADRQAAIEVARADRDAKAIEHSEQKWKEGIGAFERWLSSKGGLLVCGALAVIGLQAVFGTGPLLDLLSGLVALSHSIGAHTR